MHHFLVAPAVALVLTVLAALAEVPEDRAEPGAESEAAGLSTEESGEAPVDRG